LWTQHCAATTGSDSRETTVSRIRLLDSPTRGRPRTADPGYRAAVGHRQRVLAPGAHAPPGTLPTRARYRRAHSGRAGAEPNCLAVGPGPGAPLPAHERAVTSRASYITDSRRTGQGRVPGHCPPADTTPERGHRSVPPQGWLNLVWRAAHLDYIAM